MLFNILAIFIGLALLVVGADILVKGASNIAKRFHIPEILIGLTIVAIGTSMPELFITVVSAQQGSIDLIVGNSIGSDLCNLLFILGMMAIIKPISIQKETKKIHIPIAFLSTVIIYAMSIGLLGGKENVIHSSDGIILILLFIAYILYPILLDRKKIEEEYRKEKEGKKETQEEKKKARRKVALSILFMIGGVVLLKVGGDLVVDYATIIARVYGVSERVIGLTIVAIGTALPEMVTSLIAVITGDADIAVGNLIGSSVLNSFLILGIGAAITPLTISAEFTQNLLLLILSTALLWLFCYLPKKDTLTRPKGFILVFIFAIYMVKLFV